MNKYWSKNIPNIIKTSINRSNQLSEPQEDKYKENQNKPHCNQTAKAQRKKKARKEKMYYIQRNNTQNKNNISPKNKTCKCLKKNNC